MTPKPEQAGNLSFWQHLDVLRNVLLRSLVAWIAAAITMFAFKKQLFLWLFAPSQPDFILYKAIRYLSRTLNIPSVTPDWHISFLNTELTGQFMTHVQVALWAGLVVASPYIIYQFYRFLAPALYEKEKQYSLSLLAAAVALFAIGVTVNYLLIFPLSVQFLGSYQVNEQVVNQISLTSYMSSFWALSLMMGVMFEVPILTLLLARLGLITKATLQHYRRHIFIAILIAAAVITPTGDIFTLTIAALPIYFLYETSILLVK
ncbi:MAG: twin-arginine translocase subunit TatC [Paludibacteraceae bacterium]|nr:twin-arginine translocase subunit TatC [Paludibacteraceae bacterium]